jgi:hypothetical protein
MLSLWWAFLWIICLILPSIWILLGLAVFVNKVLPLNTPWLPDLPMDVGTSLLSIIKEKDCASSKDIRLASRSTIVVSGAITALIQPHLLLSVIIWVVVLCFLSGVIE